MSQNILSCCLIVMLGFSQHASATQIATWNLTGLPGNQFATPSTTSAPNVTGSNMVRGAGLLSAGGTDAFTSMDWDEDDSAPLSNNYVELGFDVEDGFHVDLDELLVSTSTTFNGPGMTGVYTSLDGYLSPIATFAEIAEPADRLIDLSSLPNVTGAFRVRLYQIGNTQPFSGDAPPDTGTLSLYEYGYVSGVSTVTRDVQFTGEVMPVPEPLSTVHLAIGALALAAVACRRA